MQLTTWNLLSSCLLLLATINFTYLLLWGKLVRTIWLLPAEILFAWFFPAFPSSTPPFFLISVLL